MNAYVILKLIAELTPFWLLIPWACVGLRMANTHGDFLAKHFSKSKGLRLARVDMYRGPYRRIQTIGGIGLTVFLYRSSVRGGLLDPNELDSLPTPLRRKLKWMGAVNLAINFGLLVGGIRVICKAGL